MGVWRAWIFPIIRIVIFAAIAAALVKVAFFADVAQVDDPAEPGAVIVEPQIAVERGTVSNDILLSGMVAADAAIPAKTTAEGKVRSIKVSQGQSVKKDAVLVVVWTEMFRDNGTSWFKETLVKAPAAGIISSLPMVVNQFVSVGDIVAQVAPSSFHVSGPLQPEQLYRLVEQPAEATITIPNGPAPFACTNLVITTPLAGSEDGASGPLVTCRVPADVRVFPGLMAEITLAGGIAEDVLVVPTTAVEGLADVGNVYFVLPDGTTEPRPVVLGINDGMMVEIVEGLEEGDLILQFIPGAPGDGGFGPGFPEPGFPMPEPGCYEGPAGEIICEDVVR